MAVEFQDVSCPPLDGFTALAAEGALIGLVGEEGAGQRALMRLAAGLEEPLRGRIVAPRSRRYIGPLEALNFSPVDVLVLDHALACRDAVVRARAAISLERLRRSGTTILLASHEEALLVSLCDEIWWIHQGRLAARGDPRETFQLYQRHVAARLRAWAETVTAPLAPSLRRGDGRAHLIALETLGANGQPTMVWQSGEPVSVRVTVRFQQPVEDPVVGIMIRTRVGMEVYGTNTELERVKLGPCGAGQVLRITFSFRCDLCPQQYTVTAASHDPDGVWHDWLEDAVALAVTDARYTAGVANLRAQVSVEDLGEAARLP